MIYYWLHVLYLFIVSNFLSKVNVLDAISRTRRVSILDCEGLRFMANFKYLFYMDLIRFELLFRSKLFEATVKKGFMPILGSQKIIYKKPLKRWTRFRISLILEGWDEKWAYHKQVFIQKNEVMAIGYTKVAFWKNKKAQSMIAILADAGITTTPKKIPDEVLNYFKNDHDLLNLQVVSEQ